MIVERPDATVGVAASPLPNPRARWLRWVLTALLALAALTAIFYDAFVNGDGLPYLYQRVQTFVTIFLGIFIEAAPFLLAGALVSGLIAVFVDQSAIDRYLPKAALPGALIGGVMGLAFPVCECGVVPVVRRLYEKGLPLSIGIAFLLAAPVVNPVVILSTYSAFGQRVWLGADLCRAHRLQLLDRGRRRADLQPRQAGGGAAAGGLPGASRRLLPRARS